MADPTQDLNKAERLMSVAEKHTQRIQPRRYKLALLTFVGLIAPVYFVPPAVSALIGGPRLLSVVVVAATIVTIMAYVIMPILTRATGRWLFAP